jgi:uncharacterized protein
MTKLIAFASAACALVTLTPLAHAASFNCSGALSRTEAAICAAPRLSVLDSEMAAVHGRLMAVSTPQQRRYVLPGQTDWLRNRNACGTSVSCIATAYNNRIFILHRFLGD